ncbi:MAG: carboxypeptidase regulatory-like domain-containing protein [Myxococcales bacterium]|nr:carboxypeptidase regulatory-like domain-containing protein [Myxococcales bacterium]
MWSAPGLAHLSAHADGYAPGDSDVPAPTARAQIHLTPESSLSGTVVTAGDARPVDGAIVAVALDDNELGASVRSDAQGRFRMTRLVPGRYQPDASGDGYRGEAGESVLLGLGQSVDGVAIVVHPASRVRGTVVIDRGGGKVEPCPRGAVMLADAASRARATDSIELDGTFAILSLVPGRYEVRVRCNGHAAQQQYPPVEVAAGTDVADLILTVTPGAVITGTARTATGAPFGDAWVSARATDEGGFFPGAFARSGDDGVYRLTGLRGGTYELEASVNGQVDAPPPLTVTVAPGGVATADIVFPRRRPPTSTSTIPRRRPLVSGHVPTCAPVASHRHRELPRQRPEVRTRAHVSGRVDAPAAHSPGPAPSDRRGRRAALRRPRRRGPDLGSAAGRARRRHRDRRRPRPRAAGAATSPASTSR